MGAKFEAIKHATSTGIMWHCENNLEQGSRIQDELKKTEIDSGKLKPIEYDRKKIESQLDEFIKQPHDDESIQSTSCKSKKKK